MKILAYNVHGFDKPFLEKRLKTNTSLFVLNSIICKKSDVISLHCPLNEATKYMFDNAAFSKMKQGLIFINTARGGIVNTEDLIDALNKGTVASAGLDVYQYEKTIFFCNHADKPIEDDLFMELRAHPHVLITGHQAFLTNEALQGIADTTVSNIDGWAQNGISENELN